MAETNELQRLRDEEEKRKSEWRDKVDRRMEQQSGQLTEVIGLLHTTARQAEATSLVIRGNNPPVTEIPYRLAKTEEAHKAHLEEHQELKKWLYGIAATVVTGALALIWGAIKNP